MPLPLIHGLSAASPYFKNKLRFDFLALGVSTTLIDLEPLFYISVGQPLDHQMLHGYALALTVYPVFIALGLYLAERFFESKFWSIYNVLRLKPKRVKYPIINIYLCCLFGAFSHLFFDMFTHQSMPYVIYPFAVGNPFYVGQASGVVELAAVLLAVYSVYNWLKKGRKQHRNLKIPRANSNHTGTNHVHTTRTKRPNTQNNRPL